jgi:hypothetical protein
MICGGWTWTGFPASASSVRRSIRSARVEDGPVQPMTRLWMSSGQVFGLRELFVVDSSILPTSLGVNPQVTVMAMATRLAQQLRERPLPLYGLAWPLSSYVRVPKWAHGDSELARQAAEGGAGR